MSTPAFCTTTLLRSVKETVLPLEMQNEKELFE